jgi:ATP-dependent DNA helicase RecG
MITSAIDSPGAFKEYLEIGTLAYPYPISYRGRYYQHLRFESSGLWTEFSFAEAYLQSIQAKTPIETPVKTSAQILTLLREQPTLRLVDAAALLGKSHSAVARSAKKMREEGRLRHVGPKKGGHWEIME